MIGWIAPTDYDWFTFLAARQRFEEVNFWTPSTHFAFRSEPGTPFFFKLKAPHNAIAGFGYFSRYDPLPEFIAWDCFGEANGGSEFRGDEGASGRNPSQKSYGGRYRVGADWMHRLGQPRLLPPRALDSAADQLAAAQSSADAV